MTTAIFDGQTKWSMDRDSEGHRTYNIQHQVLAAAIDGPAAVMLTPGLPLIGSIWSFDNDIDSWAFCTPFMRVQPVVTEEPNTHWLVDQIFSTKPLMRDQSFPIEDPTLEPDRIRGSAVKYTTNPEEPLKDRLGNEILTLSFEHFRGLEFDANRHQVTIQQSKFTLELAGVSNMVDTVNDDFLWGKPARTIKLSEFSWERRYFEGITNYYIRTLGFDILGKRLDGGVPETFDRTVRQEGTRELIPAADPDLSASWRVSKDAEDNIDGTILYQADGTTATGLADVAEKTIEYYPQSNFLDLGIPVNIGF